MTTSDWVISILTGVLVLVTGYYAWQTQEMVREMRRARKLQVMPKMMPGGRVALHRSTVAAQTWLPQGRARSG